MQQYSHKQNPITHKMIIQQEQVGLITGMQGWFNMGVHQHNSKYKQTKKINQHDHIIRC